MIAINWQGIVVNPANNRGYIVKFKNNGETVYTYIGLIENEAAKLQAENNLKTEIKEAQAYEAKQQASGAGTGGSAEKSNNRADRFDLQEVSLKAGFKSSLASVLIDNKFDRRLPKRKRGKLAMQGLWRVQTGASNVFSQKLARKGKNYSVVFLVDVSGSMHGQAMLSAAETASFLGKHFEANDIEFSVIGFNDQTYMFKTFDDKFADIKLQKDIINAVNGGTQMLKGLKEAVKQLSNSTGGRLVIVLSDGNTDSKAECRRLVNSNSDINFFGVGIEGANCDVIPQHSAVANLGDLQQVILHWLKQNIRRGV